MFLRMLYEKHGGCGCSACETAEHVIAVLECYRETGEFPAAESHVGGEVATLRSNPRFMKIVSPNGYPVAEFYTDDWSPMMDSNYFLLGRETLAGIVGRARDEGRPSGEHERALEELDKAIQEWAQTPWDGK